MKAFGPVPSRRLGNSLGINNIPYKVCTYSCVYCQIGKTEQFLCKRQRFYESNDLATEVAKKVSELKKRGTKIDYLSFVPDGEPTLDINLDKNIELLKPLGIKIAVITNGSLLDQKDVIEDLQKADLVSLKIDAVNRKTWLRINRPDKSLDLKKILDGMLEFSALFEGEIITETMLIKGINDNDEEIKGIAGFLALIKPSKAYISIPTRPTAIKRILPAGDQALNLCYQIFKEKLPCVEYLISSGEKDFGFTGNIEEDLLGITSVHPMREDAVREYLKKANADWDVITDLINKGSLTEIKYQGENFYLKKFSKKS
jgi:wyosine [tRNA(Phe)-imidazoG37] synthetase (radical SAM superfamily)